MKLSFSTRGWPDLSWDEMIQCALDMGFAGIMAGPLVRSSYRSGSLWSRAMKHKGWEIPENLRAIAGAAETESPFARQEAHAVMARHGGC